MLRRKGDVKHLKAMLEESDKNLKLYRMKLELNKNRKEHDTMVIHPKHKSLIQVEVKAIKTGKDPKSQVNKAISQLNGGLKELSRIHGHVLDSQWKYKGVIALPSMTLAEKNAICTKRKICDICRRFILIGNMETTIPLFIEAEFPTSQEFQDKDAWWIHYKKLQERMAAFVHLAPAMRTMKQITGESEDVQGGFSANDFLPDLLTCSVSDLERRD